MKYLIDTNILLRFFELADPLNTEVVSAVDKLTSATTDVCVCAQVLIEFWAAATRPLEANGFGLSAAEAEVRLDQIEALFTCLPEPPDIAGRWRKLAVGCSVLGRQAHDARIAALMLAHGVTHILTLNTSDFTRYQGIIPISPAEALSA
ncbi:MAG: type II toxin-antitoxin system VapC family toxin [Armatimonadetes bacterium]|nr:type II toxin-antitoxin system VapC family toxin [Armatimonadota bacterium]